MGSVGTEQYSVPEEARQLLQDGILRNSLVGKHLPSGALEASRTISFEGSTTPSIPINWRFAESISSLKGLEATVLNVLLKKKYNLDPVKVNINTYRSPFCSYSRPFWLTSGFQRPCLALHHVCPDMGFGS